MQLRKNKKSSGIGKYILFILLAALIGGGVYTALVFFENGKPQLTLAGDIDHAGKNAEIVLSAGDEKSGLRLVRLVLRQNDKEYALFEKEFPRRGYTGQIGPASFSEKIDLAVAEAGMADGEAELIATAADYSLRGWLKGNTAEQTVSITIDTVAPKLRLVHAERYIDSGGSGVVIYELDDPSATKHGAEIAGHFHQGHALEKEGDNVFIAYIAVPYDAEEIGVTRVIAEDAAGNTGAAPFATVFKKSSKNRDTINVGDGFLNAKIPEFESHYPEMQGDMLAKYLYTNGELRRENNTKIHQLCQNPESERLWSGRFLRMAGATLSLFADYRTYYYQGQEIDRQVHLGMDIASTQHADIEAANGGKVIFADYLGIYGNMMLIDHGQGVFSLYSHMSSMRAAAGDVVAQGDIIGQTGKSGMAGGDHLHFSMLINGIFVTPLEWWDPHWIEVTIEGPVADARFR